MSFRETVLCFVVPYEKVQDCQVRVGLLRTWQLCMKALPGFICASNLLSVSWVEGWSCKCAPECWVCVRGHLVVMEVFDLKVKLLKGVSPV